jgi:molybdopterin synthase catalytic subunit
VRVPAGDTWVGLTEESLPVGAVTDWAVRPDCGALVLFVGTVRDSSEGRPGVSRLAYEAYPEQVEPRLRAVADDARARWPLGRVALLHRQGELGLGEAAVVVAVTSPHRPEAFAAARFCIDTLKATVPIWKHETWDGGEGWGLCAHDLAGLGES